MKSILPVLLTILISIQASAQKISDFVSIAPGAQTEQLILPPTHTFQSLVQTGIALPDGSVVQVFPDFTGFVPVNGSSREGQLAVNYEVLPGGVSVYDIFFNTTTGLWEITGSKNIDFLLLAGSGFNCSGGVSPWGTTVTSEEPQPDIETVPTPLNDLNMDGYIDQGWNTEIDPVSKTIVDQDGDGNPDKLWKMGRIKHENVAFTKDGSALFQGADDGDFGFVYKFVPDVKGKLGAGKLYFLKMDGGENDVYTPAGSWIQVPNSTKQECNDVQSYAAANGATNFKRVEDVEVGPDNMIYFAATSPGNIYRFTDSGESVSDFTTWVKKGVYPIQHASGTDSLLFEKCDNLVFDCEGNMWVTEDGTQFHVWVVDVDHTPADPKIRLFMNTPKAINDPTGNIAGAEPTGLTFTPDCDYGFISLQRCGMTNITPQTDASGLPVIFNRDITFVFARNEKFGPSSSIGDKAVTQIAKAYPNPSSTNVTLSFDMEAAAELKIEIIDPLGRIVGKKNFKGHSGANLIQCDTLTFPNGTYTLIVKQAEKIVMNEQIVVAR